MKSRDVSRHCGQKPEEAKEWGGDGDSEERRGPPSKYWERRSCSQRKEAKGGIILIITGLLPVCVPSSQEDSSEGRGSIYPEKGEQITDGTRLLRGPAGTASKAGRRQDNGHSHHEDGRFVCRPRSCLSPGLSSPHSLLEEKPRLRC